MALVGRTASFAEVSVRPTAAIRPSRRQQPFDDAIHTDEAFARERPGWAPLARATVKRRGSAHPILQRSGQLAASITPSHGREFAAVTAPKVIAIATAFGALQRR